jgi:hypothetical protein
MPFETAFSLAGVTAIVGWVLLLASPPDLHPNSNDWS